MSIDRKTGLVGEDADSAYRANYLESLRREVLGCSEQLLTPLAVKYNLSTASMDAKMGWMPTVLILGNYSSGKSTLINEMLGREVQRTGQAPTDDCFTVITYKAGEMEERDGFSLVESESLPFGSLKKYGSKFRSHFRMKAIDAPILKEICIIDTPGMVDSVTELNRGYDYQKVIGELAEISDLILLMFDPHKAGTIRETYESLKQTLPTVTSEDRIIFVMNRVDECQNLNDLLRVYGTLCWNLSQMTGRKDIPLIYMTWAEQEFRQKVDSGFLAILENQREDLKRNILKAPKAKLYHLVSYLDQQAAVLSSIVVGLQEYSMARVRRRNRSLLSSLIMTLSVMSVLGVLLIQLGYQGLFSSSLAISLMVAFGAVFFWGVAVFLLKMRIQSLQKGWFSSWGDRPFETDYEQELWEQARPVIENYLEKSGFNVSGSQLKADLKKISKFRGSELREAKRGLDEMTRL